MGRPVEKLSALQVERNAKKPGLHGDGGGLYLRVTSAYAQSWVFRYMLDGTAHEMGLGPYPDVTLARAREKATDARRLKADGIDPIRSRDDAKAAAKLEAAKAIKFKDAAERYIAAHKAGWKNEKHGDQWTNTLTTYAYPVIGTLPAAEVDTSHIVRILDPIWNTKTETASRVRGRIERVLDWCTTMGFRRGENPARWRGHLEHNFAARATVQETEHHPALPYAEIGAFMQELQKRPATAGRALEFTILTAARTDQVIRATWAEIDLSSAMWTIPGRRMKGKKGKEREHRVPLSKPAMEILRRQHEATSGKGFIFPGQKKDAPLSNMAMLTLLQVRMGRENLTVHGFRSSFKDWAAEKTAFPNEVSEAALAHVIEDETEAAYRRGDLLDKRRKLMDAWGTYATRPLPTGDKVVPIRKGA